MNRSKALRTNFTILSVLSGRTLLAQTLTGGDQISTTVNSAASYLQKLALGIFVILLIIGALRMALDPQHRSGVGVIVGCIIGIAITVLAPVVVQVVQGWSGGLLGF